MLTRTMAVAFACVMGGVSFGQLPSDRFSPINYFGRYHGFGYSDGYHKCESRSCVDSNWQWNPLSSMSSYYGNPTSPPASNCIPVRRAHPSAIPSSYFDVPCADNCANYAPLFPPRNSGFVAPSQMNPNSMNAQSMNMAPMQPNAGSPYPQGGYAPQPAPPMNSYPNGYPAQPSSPSDRLPQPNFGNPYEMPTPVPMPEAPNPVGQLKRIPPGSKSYLQSAAPRTPNR